MSRATTAQFRDDAGLTLVEVLVALVVLAALAVAFAPLLVQGLRQSAANATLATAIQHVNDGIQRAQGTSPDCGALVSLAGWRWETDERGTPILVATRLEIDPGDELLVYPEPGVTPPPAPPEPSAAPTPGPMPTSPACPDGPWEVETVKVTVTATAEDGERELASASTRVYVIVPEP